LLATKTELGKTDISALLALLFCEVGLEARPEGTPSPTYFEAGHLKSKEAPNVRLLGISGIENVNRLGPDGLNFASEGLTVIYGDNGSGKTGFIRILRKAPAGLGSRRQKTWKSWRTFTEVCLDCRQHGF
jgi:hypothetical protein